MSDDKISEYENRIETLEEEISTLEEDAALIINSRMETLQEKLDMLSDRKGTDREPRGHYPDSKTMWQARRDELMELRNDPHTWVEREIQNRKQRIAYAEEKLAALED